MVNPLEIPKRKRRQHWILGLLVAAPRGKKHNEMGPNLRPLPSAPDAAPWMPNINPPDYNWDARWLDIDVSALRSLMDERRDMDVEYDRPDLSKEALGDPYQRLFE